MACLAVFALPTLSVSMGSGALAASALVSFVAVSSVQAEPNDASSYVPEGDWGETTTCEDGASAESMTGRGDTNMTLLLRMAGSNDWSSGPADLHFGEHEGNLKIVVELVDDATGLNLSHNAVLNSSRIWFAGGNAANNQLRVTASTNITSDVQDIYITDINLLIGASYSGIHKLNANLHIAGNRSFSIGGGTNSTIATDAAFETSGNLEVVEDSLLMCATENSHITVDGTLSGTGTLSLRRYNYTHTANYFALLGGTDNFTGKIRFVNGAELRLGGGQTYTIAGLEGSASDNGGGSINVQAVDGVSTATLTLSVADGTTVTFSSGTGTSGNTTYTGNLRLGAGVSLVKLGGGTQVFASGLSAAEQVSVQSGTLSFSGGDVALAGGLSITGGKVEVSSAGSKSFGPIALGDGTEFIIKNRDGWGAVNNNSAPQTQLSVLKGAGTLAIDGVDLSWNAGNNWANRILTNLLTSTGTSNTPSASSVNTADMVGALELRNGARLDLGQGALYSYMQSVKELRVKSGTTLGLRATNVLQHQGAGTGVSNTLVLEGTGYSSNTGALYCDTTVNVGWAVRLAGSGNEVKLVTNANTTMSFTNAFDAAGHTLVKAGAGQLTFTNSALVSGSGVLQLDDGRIDLQLNDTATNRTAFRNYGVRLNKASSELLLQIDTTVAWLEGKIGLVSSGSQGGVTLTLESESGTHEASFEIKHNNSAAENTRLHLTKKGGYTQSIGAYHAGELNVLGGTLHVQGEINNYSMVSDMQSSVAVNNATLQVDGAMRTLNASLSAATVELGAGSNVVNGAFTATDGSVVTVGSASASIDANLQVGGSFLLEESTLTVHGSLNSSADDVQAVNSTLTLNSFATSNLLLRGSRLNLVKSMTNVDSNVTLADASSISLMGTGNATQSVSMGTLRVSGAGNSIHWSAGATGGQAISIACLTGEGDLSVDAITKVSNLSYQRFMVNSVDDFNGTLTGSMAGSTPGTRGTFGFFIGEVVQSVGMNAVVNVGGYGAMSEDFRKKGSGSLSLNKLTISNGGVLYMKYSGDLSIGNNFDGLSLSGMATLRYTNDDNYLVLSADNIIENGQRVMLNIDEISVNALQSGYYLGIDGTGTADSIVVLKNLLRVDGGQLTSRDWTLEWREGKLYMTVTRALEDQNTPWDSSWGAREYGLGPKNDELDAYRYSETGKVQVLSESRYDEGARTLIKLVGGGGDAAAVIGGFLYNAADAAEWVQQDSYIYYSAEKAGSHYHLLVGGSSSQSGLAGDGGFIGYSHVQVDAGSVDYIVGGNRVSGGSFTFRGNSYISVMNGAAVDGAVVGGSVLTNAANSSANPYAFEGNSYVYIYTVLGNDHSFEGDLPGISMGDGVEGVALQAVVGGNALVGVGSGAPIFHGNSEISLDLSAYTDADKSFEKVLVGGNYVTAGAGDDLFEEGHAWINVTAGNEIIFAAGIAGASRVEASESEAQSSFHGVTAVTLSGGTYADKVVGGYWLESVAGSVEMAGSSTVEVRGGVIEGTVAGGSYSTGLSGEEVHTGDSLVRMSGGSYAGATVVGGNLAEGFSGSISHDGNSKVELAGLANGALENTNVVGGDKIEFANGGTATREGSSSVQLGAGTELVGSMGVIGGSSLSGTGGSAEMSDSGLSITKATVGTAGAAANPILVGGSYIGGTSSDISVQAGRTGLSVVDSAVSGVLVGGHAVASGTGHTVASGSSQIVVSGSSEVNGSIYGGHYLVQDTTIGTVDGASASSVTIGSEDDEIQPTIVGDVVGGSFVGAGNVTQGDISVQLIGGSLEGDVYAAGELANGQASATTNSTTVVLGEAFAFDSARETVVSGGYKGAGSGSVTTARLVLTSTASYGDSVVFADFNVVEVVPKECAVIEATDGIKVMGDTFTKTGVGSLLVEHGLKSADGSDYTGRIIVEKGELLLGADQTVAGGLTFDLNGRVINNSSNAYLQATDGASLSTAGKGAAAIDVVLVSDGELRLGSYYLASGLVGATAEDFAISDKDNWLSEHVGSGLEADLRMKDDKLYLRVREVATEKWVWGGNNEKSGDSTEDGVWKDTTVANWNTTQTSEPRGADVFFTASGADANDGVVTIEGLVTPNSVHVEGGSYVFTGEGGGLSIGGGTGDDSGHLIVGGVSGYEAELELQLKNSQVDYVDLKESGTLVLSHAEALTPDTKISFQGGTLGYGMDGGSVIVTSDLNSLVDLASSKLADGSAAKVKIRVGAADDDYGVSNLADTAVGSGEYAIWGSATATRDAASSPGVYLALTEGIEKYGYGTLRVEWQETAATMPQVDGRGVVSVEGSISVYGGRLEYLVHVADNGRVKLDSDQDIYVEDGATLALAVQGTNAVLDVRKSFTGSGVVEIGTEDNSALSFPAMNNAPYLLWGDNSKFEGTIRLMGDGTRSIENTVWASSTAALGGEKTTLSLEGRHLLLNNALGENNVISVAVVQVYGENFLGGYDAAISSSTNSGITLKTGRLEGSGVLANAEARSSTQKFDNVIESNDISGFTGTLVAGGGTDAATSTWTLRGTRAGSDLVDPYTGSVTHGNMLYAVLAGDGRIIFDYAEDVVLTNQVGSDDCGTNTTLENIGAGELVLALSSEQGAQSTGELVTHADKGVIRLGMVDKDNWVNYEGFWKGSSLSGDGAFVLTSGKLLNPISSKGDAKLNVATQTILLDDETGELEGTTVDAGGTLGSMFDDIFVNANGLLTNVNGDITLGAGKTKLTLRFGEYNIGTSETPTGVSRAMIELNGGNIEVSDLGSSADPSFVLDFTEDTFFTILERQVRPSKTTYLYVVSGGELNLSSDKWYDVVCRSGDYLRLLVYLGLEITGTPSGSVQLHGELKDVYLVADGHEEFKPTVEGYGQLSRFKATVVAKDKSLDLTLTGYATAENGADAEEVAAGGAVIHNLVGLENSRLGLHNGSPYAEDQRVTVVFDNQEYVGLDPEEANGLDTTFLGTITADKGVDIKKKGTGTLTIGSTTGAGGLVANGDVTLTEGMIVLQGGQNNSIARLEFDYDNRPESGEQRGLRLTGGSKTSITTIAESSSTSRRDTDNKIYVEDGAELVLTGSSMLASTCFVGDGTGTLTLGRDSSLTISNAAAKQLDNVALNLVSDSVLDITATTQGSVVSLSGQGKLMGRDEGVLTITGGAGTEFSGELAGDGRGTGQGGGTLKVGPQGSLTLRNVATTQSAAWGLVNDGDLVIDVSGTKHKTYFQDITLGRSSNTIYRLDTDYADCLMSLTGGLTVEGSASLTIETTGHGELNVVNGYVTLAEVGNNTNAATLNNLDVELKGVPFLHYEAADLRIHDKKLQLHVQEVADNRFVLPDMEKNARAGATLFWAASSPSSSAWESMVGDENSDLYMMITALADLYYNGKDAELSRTLAAGAGAAVSVLGSALSHDIERQLSTIRNRTTSMNAEPQHDVYDRAERIYHVWMNGEGSYFKTSADGLAPGYSLNSWGGTVGIDTDLTRQTTVGVAITAMYGDLKPDSADVATGNLDTMYLTGFARVANGAWMHTFVVTGGTADVTLNRTVNHAYGSYGTQGNTSGFSFGALYELGYARVMNAEGTFIVQSVFNVEFRHASISGYTETGSDAGLRVDDITNDVVTLGAGARAQAIVGENLYNRTSILEGRMLVKIDAGDRSGSSTHSLINGTAEKAEVESAKVGAVGVEIGAGISVPLGSSSGVIFFDASVELRRGYTSLDATAGYRFSF